METLNIQQRLDNFRESWKISKSLHHVVMPQFLKEPELVEFPSPEWEHWTPLGDSYQANKYFCSDISKFPLQLQTIFWGLASPNSLSTIEYITGIKGLIPDPYLVGGGLHLSTEGGTLAHHTDFHIYARLGLYRRLNLLIYLNRDWEPSHGGELELRGSDDKKIIVSPVMNNAVLFETNDKSVHGFGSPVAPGCTRQSLAIYYYTSRDTQVFSGDQTTYWRSHGRVSKRKRLRLYTYFFLLRISRFISLLAQAINPNQGFELVRTRFRSRQN